jgi:hypothetical protein
MAFLASIDPSRDIKPVLCRRHHPDQEVNADSATDGEVLGIFAGNAAGTALGANLGDVVGRSELLARVDHVRLRDRKFVDSSLEEGGFELSVPPPWKEQRCPNFSPKQATEIPTWQGSGLN